MSQNFEFPCRHNRQKVADTASKTLLGQIGKILPMRKKPPADGLPGEPAEDSAVLTFATNLKMLISQRQDANSGLTKQDIADALGVSLRSLTNYRYGHHIPKLDAVDKVAKLFKISAWQLLLSDLPTELLLNPELQRRVRRYVTLDEKDRDAIDQLLSKKQASL